MKKIKYALTKEIEEGNVNWDKLSEKIHAALSSVDNKFTCLRDDQTEQMIKFADFLVFKTKDCKAIKLISPRFLNGDLYCSGLQYGVYNAESKPIFIQEPVGF